jgi:uncharacterized protein (DUF983 family)
MAEDGNSGLVPAPQPPATDAVPECPYCHKGWVFKRYNELVCGRCGTRIVNFPGVALG